MKLFLCEKPSQARDIARLLGVTVRKEGYLTGNDISVTWGFGHLLELESPEHYDQKYKKWRLNDLPVIPSQWAMKIKPATKKQFSIIQRLLKQASSVIIATDADREGEMIARELLDICRFNGPIQRLWLSALDDVSIRKALSSLKAGTETASLYQAGLGRSRSDWLVGMNLTRLYTLLGQQRGLQGVFSVGRVQTPTLNLIVERDQQIAAFKPRDYWTLTVTLSGQNQSFKAQWQADETVCDDEGRCTNQTAIQQAAADIRSAGCAEVLKTETRHVTEAAPLPFDLGTLQQICSKRWGMGAQHVSNIAQSLYETHKATTYPRTDCGYLPCSMLAEAPQIFKALQLSNPALKPLLTQCALEQKSRAWDDSKITAHHAIIPTMQACDLTKMSNDELRVYDLICRHYLAQFLPLHELDKAQIWLRSARQTLLAKGTVIKVIGWKVAFSTEEFKAQTLPSLPQNSTCQINDTTIAAQQTTPPAHYTEGTLIAAMKNAARYVNDERLKQRLKASSGLGTEATRAGIIENLLKRGYVKKQKRYLVATEHANHLMAMLPDIIKAPGMTALWEQALDEIAAGRMSLTQFLQNQSLLINKIVKQSRH